MALANTRLHRSIHMKSVANNLLYIISIWSESFRVTTVDSLILNSTACSRSKLIVAFVKCIRANVPSTELNPVILDNETDLNGCYRNGKKCHNEV